MCINHSRPQTCDVHITKQRDAEQCHTQEELTWERTRTEVSQSAHRNVLSKHAKLTSAGTGSVPVFVVFPASGVVSVRYLLICIHVSACVFVWMLVLTLLFSTSSVEQRERLCVNATV